MPVEDQHPFFTARIGLLARELEHIAEHTGAGELPASTALFRAVCQLTRSAERLRRVVELDLSTRLIEQGEAHANGNGVRP